MNSRLLAAGCLGDSIMRIRRLLAALVISGRYILSAGRDPVSLRLDCFVRIGGTLDHWPCNFSSSLALGAQLHLRSHMYGPSRTNPDTLEGEKLRRALSPPGAKTESANLCLMKSDEARDWTEITINAFSQDNRPAIQRWTVQRISMPSRAKAISTCLHRGSLAERAMPTYNVQNTTFPSDRLRRPFLDGWVTMVEEAGGGPGLDQLATIEMPLGIPALAGDGDSPIPKLLAMPRSTSQSDFRATDDHSVEHYECIFNEKPLLKSFVNLGSMTYSGSLNVIMYETYEFQTRAMVIQIDMQPHETKPGWRYVPTTDWRTFVDARSIFSVDYMVKSSTVFTISRKDMSCTDWLSPWRPSPPPTHSPGYEYLQLYVVCTLKYSAHPHDGNVSGISRMDPLLTVLFPMPFALLYKQYNYDASHVSCPVPSPTLSYLLSLNQMGNMLNGKPEEDEIKVMGQDLPATRLFSGAQVAVFIGRCQTAPEAKKAGHSTVSTHSRRGGRLILFPIRSTEIELIFDFSPRALFVPQHRMDESNKDNAVFPPHRPHCLRVLLSLTIHPASPSNPKTLSSSLSHSPGKQNASYGPSPPLHIEPHTAPRISPSHHRVAASPYRLIAELTPR
ncbi:hypothetical protein ACRALDRAFT_206418 [Sodiomyces alcalophilus JCM 7366]|uniref:uncharacterized protein n=1 Tax=Sodiomyces alcalophilus JCM 7366 TaxID=591952 RepID=UPI0039B56E61